MQVSQLTMMPQLYARIVALLNDSDGGMLFLKLDGIHAINVKIVVLGIVDLSWKVHEEKGWWRYKWKKKKMSQN